MISAVLQDIFKFFKNSLMNKLSVLLIKRTIMLSSTWKLISPIFKCNI